ncbi:tyrosine-type recombinase/integrase [Sphingobacterium daejeonense]|uniref:tyrosine-type recombinase/integrase n=1 Tax=Sphingobacterium daejeonense TaxID=371142 RepID=UPI003D319AC2
MKTDIEVLEENKKYSFSMPKLYKMQGGKKWEVHINYQINGNKLKLRDSKGLNESKYLVTIEQLIEDGYGKREANRIFDDLHIQRLKEADKTINDYLNDIKYNPFYPELKTFGIPSKELSLLSYYQYFLDYKRGERIRSGSLEQYQTKYNIFRDYLTAIGQENITLNDTDKHLFISYFQSLTTKKDSYYNDLLNYHRMVFNYIIDIREQVVKNPLKVIKAIKLNDSEKHQIIESKNILESFQQLRQYGSTELSLMAQFIFYTLHRPDTLVKLQLKDFNLNNDTLHIPASKIKTGKAVTIGLNPELKNIINDYLINNEVHQDYYLFGYNNIPSLRGQKRDYQLFGNNQSQRQDYTLKFNHFRDNQIVKAYTANPSLTRIFGAGQNLYGYKHTSVVHLRDNNWQITDIMALTAHKKTEIAEIYARQHKAKLPVFPSLK